MFTPAGSLPGARGDRVIHWSPTRRWGPRRRGSLGHLPAIRRSGADRVIYWSPTFLAQVWCDCAGAPRCPSPFFPETEEVGCSLDLLERSCAQKSVLF